MRHDMKRVLLTRARQAGQEPGYPRHRARNADPDSLPEREGMRGCHGGFPKEFSDHLKPLERFLRKQIGRPWANVKSEILATCDRRCLDGHHLIQHVEMEVQESPYQNSICTLIVDEQGILRDGGEHNERVRDARIWRFRRRPLPPKPVRVLVSETLRYERLDGFWYELRQGPRFVEQVFDWKQHVHVLRPCAPDDPRRWKKRRIGKRELKALGLVKGSPVRSS